MVLAWVLTRLTRWLLPKGGESFPLVVAVVLITLGLAQQLPASPLLTLLAMGLVVRNLDSPEHLREVQFGRGGELFFLILFVFAGANLHLMHLLHAIGPAVVFVLARLVAKSLASYLVLRLHGEPQRSSLVAGFALMPMAGMAIGLVQSTEKLYPEFGAGLSALVLGAVAILETLGPIATEFALKRAGEVPEGAKVGH
jgi:Kef-type K+ transport system membrane component KefB